ncbi:hypothetical protein ElyMa_006052200 [Elysia marginata]|uniref:Uncharacterized protein n=1 Tax=Elysia marginata TaxID=1093978 RepID=A0AAV4GPC2_9GAST|nr:hypothetical protein ElyMa_006052200 [Elysia marginata]
MSPFALCNAKNVTVRHESSRPLACNLPSFRPSSESVNDSEEVRAALRWRKRADEINVNVTEASIWRFKSVKLGFGVPAVLTGLTRMACPNHILNFRFKSGPDITG